MTTLQSKNLCTNIWNKTKYPWELISSLTTIQWMCACVCFPFFFRFIVHFMSTRIENDNFIRWPVESGRNIDAICLQFVYNQLICMLTLNSILCPSQHEGKPAHIINPKKPEAIFCEHSFYEKLLQSNINCLKCCSKWPNKLKRISQQCGEKWPTKLRENETKYWNEMTTTEIKYLFAQKINEYESDYRFIACKLLQFVENIIKCQFEKITKCEAVFFNWKYFTFLWLISDISSRTSNMTTVISTIHLFGSKIAISERRWTDELCGIFR